MDVGDWLRGLGLGQYEAIFRDNEIDPDVLPELTESDLEKLGMPLGHRKRLLKAIAGAGATASAAPIVTAPPDAQAAERRQLTVMFVDLVGSTELSAKFDPEDLHSIIGAYHRCCTELIEGNDGFVAKYMGDGVLAYFGYPQAHEDDAERAVEAGLALVEAVAKLDTAAGVPLRVRVGIATGLVVVGDLIGAGAAREQAVVGETPNLAARLQAIAEPNTVVIADGTRKLLGNLFELEDLGSKELKGIADPVRPWRVLRASSMESRFEALHASALTVLVGREEESESLLRCWSRSKRGEGQVVLLSGEPGIGKSRLTAALLERLADEPHTRLRYFCSPQHTNSAFHPIIGQMERAAGLTHDDTAQAKCDKLDALLERTSTSTQDAALFAEMLSLPNDGRYPALQLTPQQRREATLRALILQIETLTRSDPVLMIFEDVHWIDPTSLEALGRAVDRIASLRALLIVTFRPEFEPPWIGRPHVTALTINRLPQRDVAAMIDRVAGDKLIPAGIRQDIIERADGIPLFVEEMTKAVLESGGEARRTAAAMPAPALAVPASLHASLMARLDRLGPAKEVARVGAVIGCEFSHALIAAVAGKSETELASALMRLMAAGLLFSQGVPPHANYLFKHALVQDAAYGTLLREPRRALHARIAETLESRFPEIAERQPELLADAGKPVSRDCRASARAAGASLHRSWADREGGGPVGQSGAAIAGALSTGRRHRAAPPCPRPDRHLAGHAGAAPHADQAPGRAHNRTPPRQGICRARNQGRHGAGAALDRTGGSAGGACRRPVAAVLGPLQLLGRADRGIQRRRDARTGGTVPDARAEAGGDRPAHGRASHHGYHPPEHGGHRGRARASRSRGRALRSRRASSAGDAVWLRSPGGDAVLALWILGYPEAALADADRALKDAREIGHAATLLYALFYTSATYLPCGRYQTANANINELLALADQKAAVQWKGAALLVQSWLVALTGTAADAIPALTAGLAAYRSTGAAGWTQLYLSLLAKAHAELGQFDDAWRFSDEATTLIETSKETWWEADIHRRAGEIALMSPQPDAAKAQACFERAIAVARAQQAKFWELRAAVSMARLWRDQGQRDAARDLLAPVYGWFSEGFDTLDLKEAKVLLDQLAA